MHEIQAKSILPSKGGMNLYRGCTHGCIYCDSRSKCYQMDHVFEDVEVKVNAPALLEQALRRRKKRCMIGTGAMCDPYLPLEGELELTRQCLEIIERHGFGATVLTKSDMVLRDLDLLRRIHEKTKCVVQMTLTTFDEALCQILEPHVCTTARRAQVLRAFHDAGVPTVVWLSPILPYLNDTEENLRGILSLCAQAGVRGVLCFGMGVTLRDGDREYFYAQLDDKLPGMKERYIHEFGNSYICGSANNEWLMRLFHTLCAQYGMMHDAHEIFAYLGKFEDRISLAQISLFES